MKRVTFKVQAGLFALLFLINSCLAHGEVYVLQAQQLARANQAIEIQAFADDSPTNMVLTWNSEQGSGQVQMTLDPSPNRWLATIPGQAASGTTLRYTITAGYDQNPSEASPEYVVYLCPEYTSLEPQPMVLNAKILAKSRWNSGDNAFGLSRNEEGPESGPASILCHNNNIYLLDSVKGRVLYFDQNGQSQASISLPTATASDMAIDSSDSSLIIVSQREDRMYRIRNGRMSQVLPLGVKRKLAFPSKFNYDNSSETLFAEDSVRQNRQRGVIQKNRTVLSNTPRADKNPQVVSEAQGSRLFLRLDNNPQIFAVNFEKPVFCIEETLADSNGVIWVLFTLEGDYRLRRLARVDTANSTAQTAETDIWFSFDATRRMALTRKGVVLFAGDADEGRIVRFDYTGGVQ